MDSTELKNLLDSASDPSKIPMLPQIYAKIKKLFYEKRYGFTDAVDNAKTLYDISETHLFQAFKKCTVNPFHLNLIREGLRISYLNDEGRKEEIEKIRYEVNKRYHSFGIRVMTIASTGELENIVNYLFDLKIRKNLNILDTTKEFEKIVENWDKITIFVKSTDSKKEIQERIIFLKKQKQEIFFLFAYKSAVQSSIESIAQLKKQKEFYGEYLISGKMSKDKSGDEYYKCFFERLNLI